MNNKFCHSTLTRKSKIVMILLILTSSQYFLNMRTQKSGLESFEFPNWNFHFSLRHHNKSGGFIQQTTGTMWRNQTTPRRAWKLIFILLALEFLKSNNTFHKYPHIHQSFDNYFMPYANRKLKWRINVCDGVPSAAQPSIVAFEFLHWNCVGALRVRVLGEQTGEFVGAVLELNFGETKTWKATNGKH